jgi:hypothetical protein
MTTARTRMLSIWDGYIATWVSSEVPPQLPPALRDWKESYHGTGEGAVTDEAMPEPFIGDWYSARLVTLGLNPGAADLPFQRRDGLFAKEVAETTFSEWAKTDPYGSELWESESTVNPPGKDGKHVNRYRAARVQFARRWLEDPYIDGDDPLLLELYPWHSRRVTAPIEPPAAVLDEFIWEPLRELDVQVVFAFGAPWRAAAKTLGLTTNRHFEPGYFASPGRQAVTFTLPSEQELVVVWQPGYAGPPGLEDTSRLRGLLLGSTAPPAPTPAREITGSSP